MSIGQSVNDFGYAFIFYGLLCVVPGLLLVAGALINRIARVNVWWFPIAFLLVVGAAVILGGSAYLDSAGQRIDGLVTKKNESVRIRREGDWEPRFSASVSYGLDGGPVKAKSITLSDGTLAYLPDPSASSTSLNLQARHFDRFKEGDHVQLRVLPFFRSLAFVKLADLSVRDFIPWSMLYGVLAVIVAGWALVKLAGSGRFGFGLAAALGLAAVVGGPSAIFYRDWRRMEDLTTKPLRAEATVSEVTRITTIEPFPCDNDCRGMDTEFDVPQQYDIVQLKFTPEGARDAVLAVDAADAGTVKVEVGGSLPIAYDPADPRAAQLIGATHTHHYKNMLRFVVYLVLLGGGLLALMAAWSWFTGRVGRKISAATGARK